MLVRKKTVNFLEINKACDGNADCLTEWLFVIHDMIYTSEIETDSIIIPL